MGSPIQNRIGMVFIPVSDLARAILWYSRLFNLPITQASHDGTIYDLPMRGDTGLILDSTKPVVENSSQPLCFFWTDDLAGTYEFLKQNDIPIIGSVEDIGSVSILTFRDLDNNLLMVCKRN